MARLVAAGLAILATEPPSALTIERICQVARVSRATFYRRWKSIAPILAEIGVSLLQDANPLPETSDDLRGQMLSVATNVARLLSDKRASTLLRYVFSKAAEDEAFAQMVREVMCRRSESLSRLVAQARREGRIRADFRDDFFGQQLTGPIWLRVLLLQEEPSPAFLETVVDTLYAAVACEPPTSRPLHSAIDASRPRS